jgi:hypothetical protein
VNWGEILIQNSPARLPIPANSGWPATSIGFLPRSHAHVCHELNWQGRVASIPLSEVICASRCGCRARTVNGAEVRVNETAPDKVVLERCDDAPAAGSRM